MQHIDLDLLARKEVDRVALLGYGSQARYQLEALLLVRRPRRVVVWGPSVARATGAIFLLPFTLVAASFLNGLAIPLRSVYKLEGLITDRHLDNAAKVMLGDVVKKLSKPEAGQLKDLPKVSSIREFRVDSVDEYSVGQVLGIADVFAEGDLVDVTGISKGKGFAGVIKRHNFHRGPKTHGSDHHRAPGSIGPGTTPGRVYRGLKMSGHMGDERVTIKKVRVVRTDTDRNLLLVNGSLPGARGSLILVKKA